MKKLFLLPILGVLLASFCGCNVNINTYLKSNVSENCDSYYVGETNDFYINLFSGQREQNYKLDGISSPSVPYCIISVTLKNDIFFKELQYSVEIADKTYDGVLKESPYDDAYEADIGVAVDNNQNIYVYIKYNEDTQVANITNITNDFKVSATTALDIAVDEIVTQKPELDTGLQYECFLQVLNKDNADHMYFWIVNVVSSNGEIYTIVVDPSTGKILAKKL